MATQNQQQVGTIQVEEKFFPLPLSSCRGLVKQAIEHATGADLVELAPGMWSGNAHLSKHRWVEVTARALEVEGGTSVEVQLQGKTSVWVSALAIAGLIVGSVALIPLLVGIPWLIKINQQEARHRLVMMHKVWTELANVVHAPRHASYRGEPKRVYVPGGAEEDGRRAQAEHEALAEHEAVEAEEAETRARA